jgi:hypothetical protein
MKERPGASLMIVTMSDDTLCLGTVSETNFYQTTFIRIIKILNFLFYFERLGRFFTFSTSISFESTFLQFFHLKKCFTNFVYFQSYIQSLKNCGLFVDYFINVGYRQYRDAIFLLWTLFFAPMLSYASCQTDWPTQAKVYEPLPGLH